MIEKRMMEVKREPLKKLFELTKYKMNFKKDHPDYFYSDGLVIFVGPQGSGKTLSAVNYVYNLLLTYPKALIVTNLALKDFPFDNERVFPFNNSDDLERYNNGEQGVIYLIDEIHLYFNSLESKNINMDVMTQFAQQRKQRKHIVATSQVFGRMAKPLREQFSNIIVCTSILGVWQHNYVLDRDSLDDDSDTSTFKGQSKFSYWFIHSPRYYDRYDTYYTISRTKFISNEMKKGDIYENGNIIVSTNSDG